MKMLHGISGGQSTHIHGIWPQGCKRARLGVTADKAKSVKVNESQLLSL